MHDDATYMCKQSRQNPQIAFTENKSQIRNFCQFIIQNLSFLSSFILWGIIFVVPRKMNVHETIGAYLMWLEGENMLRWECKAIN